RISFGIGDEGVCRLLGDHKHGSDDEVAGNARKYRGIDDPKPADAMDLKAAVHHGSLVPESGHIRLPRVAAHPAGATGVVAPSFVLDPFAQLRRVLLASGARLDLRLHARDLGVDRADAFHGLAERLEIRLSATWRERIEVDV